MPQMGYDMQEGTVVRWLKSEGSEVKLGEAIAEIETDKAVVEFESYAAGVIQRILVPEGTTVAVGQVLAVIAAEGEVVADVSPPPPAPEPEARPATAIAAPPPIEPEPPADASPAFVGETRASPVARRLADERDVDLRQVTGTGPGGRITKDDVLAFTGAPEASETPDGPSPPAATPPPAPESPAPSEPGFAPEPPASVVPISRMRQQIARVTVRSKQEKPHFYVTSEIDMTEAMQMRRQVNGAVQAEGVRITVNDLIIKACVEALKTHPKFNSFFQEDGVLINRQINIGVAVAEEEGLIIPAIMDCGPKSLREIALASKDLADRAKSGTLRPQEYTGGTFAISNLGMFDVTSFIAIIQPPQSAVLAVGTVAKRPVVRDDQIVIREVMNATLSADHRITDGAEGAQFLVEVKRLLESPYLLTV